MTEAFERMENTENAAQPEAISEAAQEFLQISQEMEAAGNHDMAQYYAEKARAMTDEAAAPEEAKLGGWYAGYTSNQWRDMAKAEYVKNGDTLKYKQYCDFAMKANN